MNLIKYSIHILINQDVKVTIELSFYQLNGLNRIIYY